ncbi:unnamed protein product, partial [marine sediment metagenome]
EAKGEKMWKWIRPAKNVPLPKFLSELNKK